MFITEKHGFKVFGVVWLGQLFSVIGTGLTSFALGVWVFMETGSVTDYALIMLAVALPGILVAPFAGVIVDRFDRRWVMIVSDVVSALSTLAIFLLLITNQIEVWHIYINAAIFSISNTFHYPAYSSTVTLLVPKKHLGRANGMIQMLDAIGIVIAPLLAGVLMYTLGIYGVIMIDFVTFLIAVSTLLLVRFPEFKKKVDQSSNEINKKKKFFKEALAGWSFITERPGFVGLLLFFVVSNFFLGFFNALLTPLILSFADEKVLGSIMSAMGAGMVVGGLVMSIWGGPKRRIHGLLGFGILSGIFLALVGLQASPWLIGIAIFFAVLGLPIGGGSSQAIWQSKVAPELQGRVFAFRRMIGSFLTPLSYIIVGPLVDHVFEPLMSENGALASSVGNVIGVGPGRGIGLVFIIIGSLWALTAIISYLNPRVRNIEDEITDALDDANSSLLNYNNESNNKHKPVVSESNS